MFISRIKLKNYIGILNGSGRTKLEIHFNKEDEISMYVVAGCNGSGKTTLMMALNALADTTSCIIPGKNGYKEIDILNGNILYKIKHVYKCNSVESNSYSTKSFIIKCIDDNEIELNENGNVTSFKSIIENELGINDDYLKMIRLGSSFKSFVGLTTAERSKLISKFLSDISIYLQYHKKVSDKARVIASLSKNISSKIDRINRNGDVDDMYNVINVKLEEAKRSLNLLQQAKNKILVDIHSNYENIDLSELNLSKEIKLLEKELKNAKDKDIVINVERILSEYKISCENMISNEYRVNLYKQRVDDCVKELDINTKIINDFNIRLGTISKQLEDIDIDTINAHIEAHDNAYFDVKRLKNTFTNVEYDKLSLYNIRFELYNAYKLIMNLHSNSSYECFNNMELTSENSIRLLSEIEQLKEKRVNINNSLIHITSWYNELSNIPSDEIAIINNCGNKNCYVFKLIKKITDTSVTSENTMISSLREQLVYIDKNIEDAIRTYNTFEQSRNIRQHILDILVKYPDYIKISCYKDILNNIDSCIYNCKPLYNDEEFDKESDNYQAYESYNHYKKIYDNFSDKIGKMVEDQQYYNKLIEELELRKKEKLRYQTERERIQNELKDRMEMHNKFKNDFRYVRDNVERYKSFIEKTEKLNNLKIEYANVVDSRTDYMLLKGELKHIEEQINDTNKKIEHLNKDRDTIHFYVTEKENFNKEMKTLKDVYRKVDLVRTALSANKGIPLIYIDSYLKNVKHAANTMLRKAFDGKYLLCDFIINDKEFRIPFIKTSSNSIVNDITEGSEGEKIILSLVLSFAFSTQISSDYNIFYLDEVDGPLDKKNRFMFAHAVQKQIDLLGIEQLFIISHNDAYAKEDVSFILFKDHGLDSSKLNVLFDINE